MIPVATPPGRIVRLFVYGTLQPQAATPMADWIARRLVRSEPATMRGRLYAVQGDCGWFPALVRARGGGAQGTLCTVRLTRDDMATLDRYEGSEYRRAVVPVRTLHGRRIMAQAYVWRVGLPADSPAIAGGDFLAWLDAGRRRAFCGT